MRGRFDVFLFADYSGAEDPGAQRRAIALWSLERGGGPAKVHGPFTRQTLRQTMLAHLCRAQRRGRRVLFGIDHQWSWPRDLWRAAGLAHQPWRAALARLVKGGGRRPPLGPPRTFPAAFNAFADARIFHCRVEGLARRYRLPSRSDWRGDPVRLTERAMAGTKPANRLGGAGAVAGQTLHGLVHLHRLLEEARAADIPILVWPLTALVDDGRSHVGVEIYPRFCRSGSAGTAGEAEGGALSADDVDARACCEWASRADLPRLLDLRRAPPRVRRAARLEGWILGADPRAVAAGPAG